MEDSAAVAEFDSPDRHRLCLAVVIGLYFYNNPLAHAPWFLSRRFINWFLLGMTYSFQRAARKRTLTMASGYVYFGQFIDQRPDAR